MSTTPSPEHAGEPGLIEHPRPVDIAPTAQHLAKLVFLSYRYSQGAIGTQNRMLMYIDVEFYPGFMTDDMSPEVHARTHDMVGPYFLNQELHPATAIPWDDDSPEAAKKTDLLVTNELAGLFERFRDKAYMDRFAYDPVSIAASVITMDADYLSRPGGRAGDNNALKIAVSPYKRDPYDSLFVKYGLLGSNTKTEEFNMLFREISSEHTIRQLDGHTVQRLGYVLTAYLGRHPDEITDERLTAIQALAKELQDARQ